VSLPSASVGLAQAAAIHEAPGFSAAELTALPTEGWITNGGNVFNQRYSPPAATGRQQ
jgi:hypothetical protein